MSYDRQCPRCGGADHGPSDCTWPACGECAPAPVKTKTTCYIAGPMSGLPDYNYPAFYAAAARLRALGYAVENPAENPPPDAAVADPWQAFMRMGITQLVRCDAIVMLPGWEKSRGATIEHALAGQLGIPCHLLHELAP